MKAIYTPVLATGAIVALSGCSGMRLSNSNAFADDVYYDGSAPVKKTTAAVNASAGASSADIASYDSRVSSYNAKRGAASTDGRDFSQIQQYYANASTNSSTESLASNGKTVAGQQGAATAADSDPDEADSGYWVGGFYGTDSDQSYAERIVKFHRPLVSVNYYSPFFTAARYSGDWNIYVDEYGSSYLVPTWTNPWYSDYYYGSGIAFDWYWGRASWRLGWGWSGWYNGWDFGWGYGGWGLAWGWPHYHYGCGWGYPYYHHHHDWHHHFDGHGGSYNRPVYAARSTSAPRSYSGSRARGESVTTNPNGERAAQRYRDAVSADRRSYTRSIDGRSTAVSRGTVSSSASNSRRSEAGVNPSGFQSNGRASSSNAFGSNSRRSSVGSSPSGVSSRTSSRSSYTPSRSSSRTYAPPSSSSRGSSYSSNGRRGSSSTYSPSGRSGSRSYSSGASRSSSSRSFSSAPGRSYSGSQSVGSGRSSGGFRGGSRSGGGSHGGGGRSR